MATSANDRQHGGDHYKGAEYQHWDWVTDCKLSYLAGVASKYAFRWRRKDGILDLEKSIHYVDKCIENNMVGSLASHRVSKFWVFVLSNHVSLDDAAIIFYIMEGEWALARAGLAVLLESNKDPK